MLLSRLNIYEVRSKWNLLVCISTWNLCSNTTNFRISNKLCKYLWNKI